MSSVPLLSDAQWSRIENILPESRQDRTVITAILYLEHCGQPLRHVGEQYGLSQTRLHEWHRAIEADGTLGRIMAALKLEPASAPARSDRPFHSHNPAMVAQVTALRLGIPVGRSTRRVTVCEAMQLGSIDHSRPVMSVRDPAVTALGAEIVNRRPSCPSWLSPQQSVSPATVIAHVW